MYIYIYVCVCVCVCVCAGVRAYVRTYVRTYIYIYIYIDSCGKTLRTEYEYLLTINLFAKLWENEVVARCIYTYSLNIDIFLMIDQVILKR